jgi:glycosyltransferase involved in cell wall biosynthesis
VRIVLASFASLPASIGGGEVHLWQVAKGLQAKGHAVSILTIERIGGNEVRLRDSDFDGVRIDYLQVPKVTSIYARDTRLTNWAKDWLQAEGVEILHLFLFNQLLGLIPAANKLGIPVCLTALEFSYFCRRYDLMYAGRERCSLDSRGAKCESCILDSYSRNQRLVAGAARTLPPVAETQLRQSIKQVFGDRLPALGQRSISRQIEEQRQNFDSEIAAVITPSTVMRDFYLLQGVAESKLRFIPYGSDLNRSAVAHRNGHYGLRVGYIGRLDPKKGVDLLCEAVRMLPPELPVELRIYGPTENGGAYTDVILDHSQSDRRIKLCGKLNRDEVVITYNSLDVLVVPSIWYENSPITVSESLSMGCPVICSDTAGMTDLVRNEENGLTFPVGSNEGLAKCLQRLVEQPGLLTQLRKGVRPVETTGEIVTEIEKVYESVLTQSQVTR